MNVFYSGMGRFYIIMIVMIAMSLATFEGAFAQKKRKEIENDLSYQIWLAEEGGKLAMAEKAREFLLFDDYDHALILYLKLDSIEPLDIENYFKIGVCYLNSSKKKSKALPYLEYILDNYEITKRNAKVDYEFYYYLAR